MTQCYLHPADLNALVTCEYCDWSGRYPALDMISDLEERVTPGEIVPAGECPECGSLAHLDPPPEWSPLAKLAQAEARVAKLTAALEAAESVVAMVAGDQHESERDEDEPDAEAVLNQMAEAMEGSTSPVIQRTKPVIATAHNIYEGADTPAVESWFSLAFETGKPISCAMPYEDAQRLADAINEAISGTPPQ